MQRDGGLQECPGRCTGLKILQLNFLHLMTFFVTFTTNFGKKCTKLLIIPLLIITYIISETTLNTTFTKRSVTFLDNQHVVSDIWVCPLSEENVEIIKNFYTHWDFCVFFTYTAKILHLLYKCSYFLCAVSTLAYVWPTFNEDINM